MEASHVVFDLGSTLVRTPPAAERHRRRLDYFRKLHGKLQSLGISAQFPQFASLSEGEFASGLTTHLLRLKGLVEDWHLKDSVLQFLHQWKDAHTGNRTDILQVRNLAITIEDAVEDDSLLDVSGYEARPDAISALTSLKSSGKHISVYINTCHPLKYRKILQMTGLAPLLDFVFFSCETQVQFPSREINTVVLNTLGICESAVIYIGDMLDRTIKSAQLGGTKAIWVNFAPADEDRNRRALESGLVTYPRAVHSLNLVENAIKFYCGDNAELKIGYFLPRGKKRILMGQKRCFRSTNRLWYNAIDAYMDLEQQGQFSVLVHKTVDLLTMHSPEAQSVLLRLQEYLDRHKEVCVIDSLERLDVCADRKLFLSLMKQVLEREHIPWSIRIPWHCELSVISANSSTEVVDSMRQASVSFPVIVKTVTSTSTPASHLMFIVFDADGLSTALSSYSEPLIIQEYINHDATVYKAYIFGEFEEVIPRESCGNLAPTSDLHCVQFYSNERWPDSLKTTEKPIVKPIEKAAFAHISALIQREFHLSLFGFDVLLPQSSSDFILIDLNHFPGYKEIADLSDLMDNLVLTLSSRYRLTVKALLERTNGLKGSASESAPMPPEPALTPKERKAELIPNFEALIAKVRPLSPDPKQDVETHYRTTSLHTPRGRKHPSRKLDELISAYLKSKQAAEKPLQSLSVSSSNLLSYLSQSLRSQGGSQKSVQKCEDDFKTTAKEVLMAVKTEAVAMDRKCSDLKRENAILRDRLTSVQAQYSGKDVMSIVRLHASRKLPPITAFPDTIKRLRALADELEDEDSTLETEIRNALVGEEENFFQDMSVLLCKQILLERNLCIKSGEGNRNTE